MNLKFETIVQIVRKIIQLNHFEKYYANTNEKLSKKVAAKRPFILLCVIRIHSEVLTIQPEADVLYNKIVFIHDTLVS